MDPFLPGEIPVMVLRYLAVNKCEAAALALIDEMPLLKAHVPPKPVKLSNSDYLKYLARSSVNSGLKEILSDYGNSKILAEEILESESSNLPEFPLSDTLISKLKTIQDLFKTKPSSTSSAYTSPIRTESSSSKNSGAGAVKVDSCVNTVKDYQCPQCLLNHAKQTTESCCQTDEVTAVPVKVYNTLMNDELLQYKLAQTINGINEFLEDPQGERNDDDVQRASSKTENEIDKFLVELLQDMPDDNNGCDGVIPQNLDDSNGSLASSSAVYAEVDNNLSDMFGDTGDMQSQTNTEREQQKSVPSTSTRRDSNPKTARSEAPSMPIPVTDTELGNSNCSDTKKDQGSSSTSSSTSSTPKQSQRGLAVKRITPTPLTSANVNPVSNTSVVIEKQTVNSGENSATFSVVKKNSEPPPWQKLNRKPIVPKIPGLIAPKVTEKLTIVNKDREIIKVSCPAKVREIIKVSCPTKDRSSVTNEPCSVETVDIVSPPRTEKLTVVSEGREVIKVGCPTNDRSSVTNEPYDVETVDTVSPLPTKNSATIHPTSSNKRKATPAKLTPEKAKNCEFNYIPNKPASSASHATSSKTSNKKDEPSANTTPAPPSSSTLNITSNEDPNPNIEVASVPLTNENSLEVTPMQPPPPTQELGVSSGLKTISPNAIQRLIASANKQACSTAAPVHFPKKKSYSTPGKRKHVRSLKFATPPSLKGKTPQGGPETDASTKRKADEEWKVGDFKSKKRLNWPESEKKTLVEPAVTNPEKSKISDNQEEASGKKQDHASGVDVIKTPPSSQDNASKIGSMSIILEESVVEVETPAPIVANAVNDVGQVPVTTNAWTQPTNSSATYMASNVNNTMEFHSIPLGEDMQSIYPIQLVAPGSSAAGMHPATIQQHLPPTTTVTLIQNPKHKRCAELARPVRFDHQSKCLKLFKTDKNCLHILTLLNSPSFYTF